jgi:predicted DCC family thiol-disulfide oxidoreductase YuxK
MARSVLLYDAACGACTWLVARILAWDRARRVRPVALQDPEAELLLSGMDEPTRMASWHLVPEDGSVISGGAVLAPLLRELPGGGRLAAAANRMPRLIDRGYRWAAAHRILLGRPVPRSWKESARDKVDDRAEELRAESATSACAG